MFSSPGCTVIREVMASPSVETGARAWQRMLSGRRLDLLNPSPLDIEGLSRSSRRPLSMRCQARAPVSAEGLAITSRITVQPGEENIDETDA